jgi:hypothetical protein
LIEIRIIYSSIALEVFKPIKSNNATCKHDRFVPLGRRTLRLTYSTRLVDMDPSRVNTASWSARDYAERSYIYTPEKMLPGPAEEGSESAKEAAKPESMAMTNTETGEANKQPRTPLPTSRPLKQVIFKKITETSRRAKKAAEKVKVAKVVNRQKMSSKTGKKNIWDSDEDEEQDKPLEKQVLGGTLPYQNPYAVGESERGGMQEEWVPRSVEKSVWDKDPVGDWF